MSDVNGTMSIARLTDFLHREYGRSPTENEINDFIFGNVKTRTAIIVNAKHADEIPLRGRT